VALGETNIIGDVTQTLSTLLADLDVTLDSPASLHGPGNDDGFARLNLYLYQVLENEFLKNQPWPARPTGELNYPPLALDLFYLLTPYASDTLTAHHVLSHAMKVLYENSIIKGSQLAESLRLSIDQLAIVLCPMQIEELTRIWNALQSPYRLSVVYEVRIVLVESDIQREASRVLTKVELHQQAGAGGTA
jgi:hypothetical protein